MFGALDFAFGPKLKMEVYLNKLFSSSQVMTGDSFSGQIYVVNVETVNSGIPYAESFYVTSNFCLSRVGDKESNLCVVSAIKYKKAVWGLVKSKIHFSHSKLIAGLNGKSTINTE